MSTITADPLVEGDELWCRQCPEPATEKVGPHSYCHEHALTALWKANSPSWNPQRTVKPRPGIVVVGERTPAAGPIRYLLMDTRNNWIPDTSSDPEVQVVSADPEAIYDLTVEVENLETGERLTVDTTRLYRGEPVD